LQSVDHPFQSTRPARAATAIRGSSATVNSVSIHAPRAGRDDRSAGAKEGHAMFQSTRPARAATTVQVTHIEDLQVSIHAPRAGRDSKSRIHAVATVVSIHAPRAGRDRAMRI